VSVANCNPSCTGACMVTCTSVGNCNVSCASGAATDCGAGVYVCDRACP
jgi:hypothetical protein